MITPYHIIKESIKKYKKSWKTILFFSFSLGISGAIASLILLIQSNQLLDDSGIYKFLFMLVYLVLTFNALFLFSNAVKFLIKTEKVSLNQLFGNFRLKIIFNLILLSIVFMTIFSLCYVFPNLILSSIAQIIGPGILNILLFLANISIMGIGIFLFIYLNFAPVLSIDDNKSTFTQIINKSWYLVKNNWWSVFLNRSTLMIFNLAITFGAVILFTKSIPIQWLEIMFTQYIIPMPLIITYLLSILIFSTILIFINLPYEVSFYSLYMEAKKKE